MTRILVVEDNEANRELLCDWLEAEGYEVHCVPDLAGAFAAAKTFLPEAVLLDIQLGNEDGLEFAAWLRRQPERAMIPVIAVTAQAMVTQKERILVSGCNACISKPVDFQLLRAELLRWLAASRDSF